MEITKTLVPEAERKAKPHDVAHIPFGTAFTDHMFLMDWEANTGWHNARIEKYQHLKLEPSALVFHYAQEAFEGLKAYCTKNGHHAMFRPRNNFERLNLTCRRMCLPELDPDETVQALKELLREEIDWIPQEHGTALYIRPTLIATEPYIGLKTAKKCLFYIILCPVGPYYQEGFNPVKIKVEEKYVRATPGGVGFAKTGGNYAASVRAENEAIQKGFTQVLWLDAIERRYVEEVGSMNIFFVINGEIITPGLTGTILPGITRDSVLQTGKRWGKNMIERRISIEEVIESARDGSLTEIFGAGTAAVISPVGELYYRGDSYTIGDGTTGPLAQQFFNELTGIQYGNVEDSFNWMEYID